MYILTFIAVFIYGVLKYLGAFIGKAIRKLKKDISIYSSSV